MEIQASMMGPASVTLIQKRRRTNTPSNQPSTHFKHGGKEFTVIDTPGYPDFVGQAIGPINAVETAVIAINATSGIEVNTRRVFDEAGKAGIGRMIAITKLDSDNIDFNGLIEWYPRNVGHEMRIAERSRWNRCGPEGCCQHAECSRKTPVARSSIRMKSANH